MSVIFIEGFEKYGPTNSNTNDVLYLLSTGDWTTTTTGSPTIAPGLSAGGYALQFTSVGTISKTLGANYSRLIGGVRVRPDNFTNLHSVIQLRDGATGQCTIGIETSGLISLRSGVFNGAIIATSSFPIFANSIHYIDFDITIGTSASYQVWLDGVSILSGTGNTRGGTTNNYANAIAIISVSSGQQFTVDDLYLFDSTGSTNNAVLLTSPRVETTFPISDSSVQFGFGAAQLGSSRNRLGGTSTSAFTNQLFLRLYVPLVNCTLNSIGVTPSQANATINHRGVIYADSSGVPGSLLSTGATVLGSAVNTTVTLPLTTPQALTAGTRYWLGFMRDSDIGHNIADNDVLNTLAATVTFTSGAPSTAPAMGTAQRNWLFWGNLTGVAVNWYESSITPPPLGGRSFVIDSTVGHEDLYGFAALSSIPAAIHVVAVKAYLAKSDSGTRTISLRTKSGATDGAGSLAGQALGTSFQFYSSYFETDPNTGSAWAGAALNAAVSGFKIDS